MTDRGLTLFDTQIGPCGIAWGDRGVICRAASREDRGRDPRAAASAMSARRAKQRRRPRCRTRSKASFRSCAEKARDLSAIALDMDGLTIVRPPRLRGRPHDHAGRDALLRRDRGPARRQRLGAGRGSSARAQPIPDHRAVPPRARGRWESGRVLRQWRDHDETAPAYDRTRAHERYAYVVRWRQRVRHSQCGPGAATRAEAAARPMPVASLGAAIHIDGVRSHQAPC